MFRFTIRDVLWLMVVVGLAFVPSRQALQLSTLRGSVKELSARTAAQRKEIHELKERELALIRAVEKKYGDRITEWQLWPDPDRPPHWKAELVSQP